MMPHAHIIGTGSCAPKRILTNQDLENIVDTSDEWITRRTGIKERRIATRGDGESTTELATQASQKALEMAGVSPKDLDLIIVGTVTGDRNFPSAGCFLQETLDATNATAFDLAAGCSGFLYSLEVANNAIRSGSSKAALVVGVERLSGMINWQDRSTCVLLGDGAGAVVAIATTEDGGILSTHSKSDGSAWELLYSDDGEKNLPEMLQDVDQFPFRLIMNGNRLFKRAVDCLSSIAREALEHNAISGENIDIIVPHQANIRIIQAMAHNLNIPMNKVYTNIHKYGNTSTASIPLALDEANREGLLKKEDHVLLVSFGAGLTWGSSIVRWSI